MYLGRSEIITVMVTSIHYPPTPEQRTHLREDLALVEERLQNIAVLMHACYGDESEAAIGADEVAGALQGAEMGTVANAAEDAGCGGLAHSRRTALGVCCLMLPQPPLCGF